MEYQVLKHCALRARPLEVAMSAPTNTLKELARQNYFRFARDPPAIRNKLQTALPKPSID
jgi:hypothetical protein